MNHSIVVAAMLASVIGASALSGQTSVRVEAGLGGGRIGEGGGLNGRVAFGVESGSWGAVGRAMTHEGGEGVSEPGLFSGLFGPPVERFDEWSLLATRSLTTGRSGRVLVGVGLGTMSGRRVDPSDGVGLADLDTTWGVPLEVAFLGGDGYGLGVSLVLSAHLNGEASQVGVEGGFSLGWGGRGGG